MKKAIVVGIALCLTLAYAKASHAWLFDAEVSSSVNNNSNNNNSRNLQSGDARSSFNTTSTSNNQRSTSDSRRYDNSQRTSDSFNSYDNKKFDNHSITDSHAISDSYNGDYDYSTGKATDSYNGDRRNYTVSGDVTKSVIGDFQQVTSGTVFNGGATISGNSNTIGGATSVSNTFGDVTVSGQKSE